MFQILDAYSQHKSTIQYSNYKSQYVALYPMKLAPFFEAGVNANANFWKPEHIFLDIVSSYRY